jgi:uncharacterized RDD family membrane protein YckC
MELTPTDQIVVETPENIRFGYDVADIGSRFLAIFIDSLIQGVLYVLLGVAVAFLAARLSQVDLPRPVNDAFAILLILVLFLIQFGYFLFFEIILNGQTPGKRLFHLRVIKDNGYPLAPLDAIIRNIVRIIDFFPAFYGIGVIVMFLSPRAKRLGDFAAGTLVVKMRDEVRLQSLMPAGSVSAQATIAPNDGVRRLTESDIELAENFLNRRAEMSDPAPMSVQIAQRLARKMELPDASIPQTADRALFFIRETVSAYRTPRA